MTYVLQTSAGRRVIDGWRTVFETTNEGEAYKVREQYDAPFVRIIKYDEQTDTIRETLYEYASVNPWMNGLKSNDKH